MMSNIKCKSKEDLIMWIDKRISKKSDSYSDISKSKEERIAIGGQLTALKQVRQYISKHLISEHYA